MGTSADETMLNSRILDVDYVAEQWKAEERSICHTLFFNTEIVIYNILLIVFGIEYCSFHYVSDRVMVYLFPSLKSFFLWLNIEFAFRYFKTAQVMKNVFSSDTYAQLEAQ